MKKYFVVAESFAAQFVSDRSTHTVTADSPTQALERLREQYTHPCGLYCAAVFEDANAHHDGREPLARWLCNHEIEKQRLTDGLGCYSFMGIEPGVFEINHERHVVENPKGGQIVDVLS